MFIHIFYSMYTTSIVCVIMNIILKILVPMYVYSFIDWAASRGTRSSKLNLFKYMCRSIEALYVHNYIGGKKNYIDFGNKGSKHNKDKWSLKCSHV